MLPLRLLRIHSVVKVFATRFCKGCCFGYLVVFVAIQGIIPSVVEVFAMDCQCCHGGCYRYQVLPS